MDNKNSAPERIELPGGYYVKMGSVRMPNGQTTAGIIGPDGKEVHWWQDYPSFAAAMQPTPTESDEAVARKVADLWFDGYYRSCEKADCEALYKVIADALARRPVPVAAPYGAEGLREALGFYAAETNYQCFLAQPDGEHMGFIHPIIADSGKLARKSLAQSPTIQGCRSVEPEEGNNYLVYGKLAGYPDTWVAARFTKGKWYAVSYPSLSMRVYKVTCVMPLPAAPKGE